VTPRRGKFNLRHFRQTSLATMWPPPSLFLKRGVASSFFRVLKRALGVLQVMVCTIPEGHPAFTRRPTFVCTSKVCLRDRMNLRPNRSCDKLSQQRCCGRPMSCVFFARTKAKARTRPPWHPVCSSCCAVLRISQQPRLKFRSFDFSFTWWYKQAPTCFRRSIGA